MEVRRLIHPRGLPAAMVCVLPDGSYMRFHAVPYRAITEDDLTPIPHFAKVARYSEEADEHTYRAYGLKKVPAKKGGRS